MTAPEDWDDYFTLANSRDGDFGTLNSQSTDNMFTNRDRNASNTSSGNSSFSSFGRALRNFPSYSSREDESPSTSSSESDDDTDDQLNIRSDKKSSNITSRNNFFSKKTNNTLPKSRTEVDLSNTSMTDEELATLTKRLQTDPAPVTLEEARRRRASIKEENTEIRKRSVSFIRLRTASRAAAFGLPLDIIQEQGKQVGNALKKDSEGKKL